MSLASDYATAQDTAAAGNAVVNATVPAPFSVMGCSLSVEKDGTCFMQCEPGTTMNVADMLAMAAWITATYG
jgi:hypothetical protein